MGRRGGRDSDGGSSECGIRPPALQQPPSTPGRPDYRDTIYRESKAGVGALLSSAGTRRKYAAMALWVTAAAFLATQAAGAVAVTPTPELPPFSVFTTPSGTEFGLTLPRGAGTGPPPRLAIALASTMNETLGRVVQSGCPSVFYFANACPWLVAQGWCAPARARPRSAIRAR